LGSLTDIHIKNAKLEEKKARMEKELEKAKKHAEDAKSDWESLRKERDFHKENFEKTYKEKSDILTDYKTLVGLHTEFTSKIDDLKSKYEHLCKNKSLMIIDCNKLAGDRDEKIKEKKRLDDECKNIELKKNKEMAAPEKKPIVHMPAELKPGDKTPWPKDVRNNIYLSKTYTPLSLMPGLNRQFKAHESSPVSCLAVHMKMQVAATGGDDASFKIFDMKNNEELVSEVAHNDYICGIDMHPKEMILGTSSGDHTVKIWDLYTLKAKHTFYDHNGVVWCVKFHDTGDFVLSCSEDSTIKLFDLNQQKCRTTYQRKGSEGIKCRNTYMGHTDSVNKITFQPFTNYFASCAADKSISIWDMRLGLTVQTFYGHINNVNDVVFNARGDLLYSCDADGVVKSWDIRKVAELNTWTFDNTGRSANCLEVDKSHSSLYVGFDDGQIGSISINKNKIGSKFKAHELSVNSMGINATNQNLYSVGSDGMLNTWQ
jgi:hypothetical protein